MRPDRHDWVARWGDLLAPELAPELIPKSMFTMLDPAAEYPKFNAARCDAETAFYRLAYNKEPHDCAVRALAVACAAPYEEAHWAMQEAGRVAGHPSNIHQMLGAAAMLDRDMMALMKPPGRTLRTAERALRNVPGGFILTTCNHAAGIWNGELIDHARGSLWRVVDIFRLEKRS